MSHEAWVENLGSRFYEKCREIFRLMKSFDRVSRVVDDECEQIFFDDRNKSLESSSSTMLRWQVWY